MTKKRKLHTAEFKLKAVLEVLKGAKTANELAGDLGVHPVVLSEWKKHFLESAAQVFEKPSNQYKQKNEEKEKAELYEQIGRLKMDLEWLKKKASLTQ